MNKYRIENPNNKDVREYKSRTTGTFKSQYGLSSADAENIFKEAGISNVRPGTRISGDAVKATTKGKTDILRLDPKSKQATPQRFVYQAMFGVLHNKVSGGEFFTDMNNYIKLEGGTGDNNNRNYKGDLKIPLLDGHTMSLTGFNSSFSERNSKVFLNGEFNHNFNGKHSSQMYNLYNGKLTQLQKMQIIMPNIETDKFESTYRR